MILTIYSWREVSISTSPSSQPPPSHRNTQSPKQNFSQYPRYPRGFQLPSVSRYTLYSYCEVYPAFRGVVVASVALPSATAELAKLTAALLASFFFLLDALVASDVALRFVTRVAFVDGAVGAAGVLATAAVAVAVLAARVAERVTGIDSTTNVDLLTPNFVLCLSLSYWVMFPVDPNSVILGQWAIVLH